MNHHMVKYIHGSDCHDGKRLPLPSETTTVIMIESVIKTILIYAVIYIGKRLSFFCSYKMLVMVS